MTRVAVLGTGRMGSAMARALARAGDEVVLYNRTPARCEPLATELGATMTTSAAAAVASAEIAISMVSDEAAIENLYRGHDGVLDGVHGNLVVADMSTVPPRSILGLERDVRAAGGGIIDAPVSGSVTTATAGQLTIMVGGTADDLERARPTLEHLAKTVVHIGPLGSAAAMKLAVNAVIFGLSNAVSEALVLAERAGIDRSVAYDVLANSAVGAPFVGYKRAAFVDPEATPTAFSLALAAKDLGLITELADELGVPVAQARTNLRLIQEAAGDGSGDDDFAAVAVHLRERSRSAAATTRGGTS